MINLTIKEKPLKKIVEWCNQLPNLEWSGTLFYRVIEESGNNTVLEAVDFYVSDIGSSTFTEYEQSPEEFAYQEENDLLDCYSGLIHSHNKMAKRISF